MTTTKAPTKTPSPKREQSQPPTAVGSSKNPRTEFFVAAANMSWQLAIVVLVPIIGGSELDKALDTQPAFTILGFIVASVGTAAVMWYQLQRFTPPATGGKK